MRKQHRHLEVLIWTLLQNLGSLRCASPAAVVQAVMLTVRWGDGRYVESVREVAVNRRQRWNRETRYSIIYHLLKKKRKIGLCGGSVGSVCLLVPLPYFADHNL